MPSETRDRIIDAAALLFQRYGYTGTGLKQISKESSAPFGSLYHFFPGGKDDLTAAALRSSGLGYQLLVEGVFDAEPDLISGVRACFVGAGEVLEATDYADACPIETVALEVASSNEPLRLVTAEIFESWTVGATSRMEAAGLPPEPARQLALALISALEGAFVLARAAKSVEPMLAAGEAMVLTTQALLDAHAKPRPQKRGAR
jgi:AcrR family transcriptional regulator